ncbi:hypothetical protein [Streptomyces sp. NPDC086777]|uniref:hypothetical protein n=1 Tax=Streptomyces sp. NPDC086777 TaxID=3154866 RepID=UPI00344DA1B3
MFTIDTSRGSVRRAIRAQSGWPALFSGGGAVLLDGGRLPALLAFEAAQDQFHCWIEAPGGAVAVSAVAGGVEDTPGVRERLLAGDHGAGHTAARLSSCPAEMP